MACLPLLWSVGCSSDAEVIESHDSDPSSPGTGCEAWRSASCAYRSRCGKPAPSCSAQIDVVNCRSESAAQECAGELHEAECGAAPVECQAGAIAETDLALAGCKMYLRAVCSSAATCLFEASGDDCLSKQQVDCSRAVGLRATFVDCLAELMDLDCKSWVVPDACAGVVVLR